jgi:hypothetical protein
VVVAIGAAGSAAGSSDVVEGGASSKADAASSTGAGDSAGASSALNAAGSASAAGLSLPGAKMSGLPASMSRVT